MFSIKDNDIIYTDANNRTIKIIESKELSHMNIVSDLNQKYKSVNIKIVTFKMNQKIIAYSNIFDTIRSTYKLSSKQYEMCTTETKDQSLENTNETIERLLSLFLESDKKFMVDKDGSIINYIITQFDSHTDFTLNCLKLIQIKWSLCANNKMETLELAKKWNKSFTSYISFATYLALLEQLYNYQQINQELEYYNLPSTFTDVEEKLDSSKKIYNYLKKTNAKYSTQLIKFPRTEHAFDAKKYFSTDKTSITRDDLILSDSEFKNLLGKPLVFEEKIDGANLGIMIDYTGRILAQNRSHYVCDGIATQFNGLDIWISDHEVGLRKILQERSLIMYGEWCYLKHSIHYTNIPDYFICFDVYDKQTGKFYSRDIVTRMLEGTGISQVPVLETNKIITKKEDLIEYLKLKSSYTDSRIEGVYIRLHDPENQYLIKRCKLVRPDFLPEKEETVHWSKKIPTKNIVLHDKFD
jgi:hypothetical protein